MMLVVSGVALALATPAGAHPAADHRLAALNRRIDESCEAATLIRRGRVLSEQGLVSAALEHLDRARRCDAEAAEVDSARAEVLLRAGRAKEARRYASRYIGRQRADGRGWLIRARAQVQLRRWAAAIGDYDQALVRTSSPQPDHFLERAHAQIRAGRVTDAARDLRGAIDRIGPAPALMTLAFDLSLEARQPDAAAEILARLDSRQKDAPPWLVRRGELMAALGREEEAGDLCRRALSRSLRGRRAGGRELDRRARQCAESIGMSKGNS